MTKPHSVLRASALAAAIGLLSACAQSVPPATPTTEPMRGAALPAPERVPASSSTPSIGTEPMRGAPLPTGSARVTRGNSTPEIGTEPMRGGPLPTSTDERMLRTR